MIVLDKRVDDLGDDTYHIVELYINNAAKHCVRDHIAHAPGGDMLNLITHHALDTITIYPNCNLAYDKFYSYTRKASEDVA